MARQYVTKPIPLYMVAYFDPEVIYATLAGLWPLRKRVAVTIIENNSPYSPLIRNVIKHFEYKLVVRHLLFDDNISNNAIIPVLRNEINIAQNEFAIYTDGDIIPYDPNWLDECLRVLDQHPDVFLIGARQHRGNLPLKNFPDAHSWKGPEWRQHADFIETLDGALMWTFRGVDLWQLVSYFSNDERIFRDDKVYEYVTKVLGRRMAITKKATFRHLTWDSYADLNHPYTQAKMSKTQDQHWAHSRVSPYTDVTGTTTSGLPRPPTWPKTRESRIRVRKWSLINWLTRHRLHGAFHHVPRLTK